MPRNTLVALPEITENHTPGFTRKAEQEDSAENSNRKNQQPAEIFLGELGTPFAPVVIWDSHPFPATPHVTAGELSAQREPRIFDCHPRDFNPRSVDRAVSMSIRSSRGTQ